MIPESLKNISDEEAVDICNELREQIIDCVSQTGGHLASSLGVVEVLVALHRVYDFSADRLVFDVGHQCYAHKILTGRGDLMKTLRQFGGISGFPKPSESQTDAFIAGHASNSVSVALGMAKARSVQQEDYHVVALLGDGAMTGGLISEGLSNAGQSGEPMVIIVNDNGMSINKNVGGISHHLSQQRLKPQYLEFKKVYREAVSHGKVGRGIHRVTHWIKEKVKSAFLTQSSVFEQMGFTYLGPVDGHDVVSLTRLLTYAKELNGPVILHVKTVKGKGYQPAELEPDKFHGVAPFHKEDGRLLSNEKKENFSSVFGDTMCELGQEESNLCLLTAAMQSGTGLDQWAKQYPDRIFDTGIAEEHATAMAAGLAKQGALPVFAVYSTFLQRGYDMLLHDVAILNLHVVFGVDRAGLVGEDGETHHGVFDVAYLSTIPGMKILCPANFAEQRAMLRHAVQKMSGPVAVRYPRGGQGDFQSFCGVVGSQLVREGTDITIIAYGTMINEALKAAELLAGKGKNAQVLKLNSIVPLDMEAVRSCAEKTGKLLIAEEVVNTGCVGRRIAAELMLSGNTAVKISTVNLGDCFITQGTIPQLRELCGIDAKSLSKKAMEMLA